MLKAYMAGDGGEVVIPDAVAVNSGSVPMTVDFVDGTGRVLVTFRRQDISMFTEDTSLFSNLQAAAGTDGATPLEPHAEAPPPDDGSASDDELAR